MRRSNKLGRTCFGTARWALTWMVLIGVMVACRAEPTPTPSPTPAPTVTSPAPTVVPIPTSTIHPTITPSPIPTVPPDRPPQVQEIVFDPLVLRFLGGKVRVRAEVIDDRGVEEIRGTVLRDGREVAKLNAQRPAGDPQRFTYEAIFQLAANTHSDGTAETYTVRILVVDTAGQESVQEAVLQVPAPAAPPAPPGG